MPVGTNEVQRIELFGAPTTGTFKLSFMGQVTASSLALTATAAQIKAALETLSTIGSSGVTCTGGPINSAPVDVTFTGKRTHENVPLIVVLAPTVSGGSVGVTNTASHPSATSLGLESGITHHWSLDEASGQRKDKVGTAHLTQSGVSANWSAFPSFFSNGLLCEGNNYSPPGRFQSSSGTVFISSANPNATINIKVANIGYGTGTQIYLAQFGSKVKCIIEARKSGSNVKFIATFYDESGGTSYLVSAETPNMSYSSELFMVWSVTAKLVSGRAYIACFRLPDSASNYGEFISGSTGTISAYDTSGDFTLYGGGNHQFQLDEITIWNRGISQDECYVTLLEDWTYPKSYMSFLKMSGTPHDGATFKLTYQGQSCTLDWDATQIEVGNALSGLSTIGGSNIGQGTGGLYGAFATLANPMCIFFKGSLASATATDITVDNTNMYFSVTEITQGEPTTLIGTKAAALPHLVLNGTALGDADREATGALNLPHVVLTGGAVGNADKSATGDLVLPELTIAGLAETPIIGVGDFSLPEIVMSGEALGNIDRVATGDLVMPELTITGAGTIERLAEGAFSLPRIGMVVDEQQEITATGIPTSGTWKLSHNGNLSSNIDFDDDNAAIQSILESVTGIGSGNVRVEGGPLGVATIIVTFKGALSGFNQPQMTATNNLGGVDSALQIQTITPGSAGTNEVQTLTFYGGSTGGTYRLGYLGNYSASLSYNATTGQIQTALQGVTGIGSGNVSVTGGPAPGTPIIFTFVSALGSQNVALLTVDSLLTGGTIFATATTTQNGSADFSSLETNLSSYWRMEETGGSAVRDDSWGSLDLSVTGTVTGNTGISGNAAYFQGPASTVSLSATWSVPDKWSIGTWFRVSNLTGASVNFNIFSLGVYTLVYQQVQNRVAAIKNGSVIAYSPTISQNTWYHLCLSVDKTGNHVEFFVNGATRGATTAWTTAMGNNLAFGSYTSGSGSMTIHIDESALYTEAVVLAKAQKLYNNGAPPTFPFLPAQNEIQQLSTSGSPSRGTIKIAPYNLSGVFDTPVAVAYNATATEVKNAIVVSSYYGSTDVNVTGGPLGTAPINIEYTGSYAQKNVNLILVDDSDLETGVAETTAGVSGTNEVQRLSTSPASLTGGFDLTFMGQTTSTLAANATASQIQSALRALPTIGATGVNVSGGPINSANVNVTFVGPLGNQDVEQLTGSDTLLGAAPTINIQTLADGAPGGTATTYLDEVSATGAITLPEIVGSGTALANIDRFASGDITLPELRLSGTAEQQNAAVGDIDLPSYVFTGQGFVEVVRRASGGLVLPPFSALGEVENTPELTYTASGALTFPAFDVFGIAQAPVANDGPNTRQSTTTFEVIAQGQYFDELFGKTNDVFKWSAAGFKFSSRPGTGQTKPGEANRFWYKNTLVMTIGQVINLDLYSFLTYNGGKGFGCDQLGLPLTMDAVTLLSIEQMNQDGVLLIGGSPRAPWEALLVGTCRLPYGFRLAAYCRGAGGWLIDPGNSQYLRLEATESTCILNIRIEGRKF